MGRLSVDTTFLIDLQREHRRGQTEGPAHAFLRDHAEEALCVSAVALGEYAEGFARPDDPLVELVVATHELLPIDADAARRYAGLTRRLRKEGQLIGTNDLWIASTALQHGLPLVTANVTHFERVPELRVLSYRG